MNLYSRFEKFLIGEIGIQKACRILLAVSGGVDSMVLLHLFKRTDHEIAVAHCNFGLRGDESEGDRAFVKKYCEQYSIIFYEKRFDLKNYSEENKTGTQESARRMRYEWFDELLKTDAYDYLATAHHLGDTAETLLFNIARGTGISGLQGIPAKNNKIIRPLLFATKNEIIDYATEHHIAYRTDSSNEKNVYSRNKIRNKIIPVLKEINPLFEEHVQSLTKQMSFIKKIYSAHIHETWKQCHRKNHDKIEVDIPALLKLESPEQYLFEFLHPYGFNAIQVHGINEALQNQSGKQFYSATHLLVKDRDMLIISELDEKYADQVTIEKNVHSFALDDSLLQIDHLTVSDKIDFSKNSFYLDADLVSFPIKLRRWIDGDKFIPLGMHAPKKISDFFIDEKVNLIDKKRSWIVCSGEDKIICLLPYRVDERFKITSKTTHALKLTFIA